MVDLQMKPAGVRNEESVPQQMQLAQARVAQVAGARRPIPNLGTCPECREFFALRTEFVHDYVQAWVWDFTARDLPETTDDASGGVVPVGVEQPLAGIQEQLPQHVSSRSEVRGQRPRERVGREAVQASAENQGGHAELIDKRGDTVGKVLGVHTPSAVADTGELVQMCGCGVIHPQRSG